MRGSPTAILSRDIRCFGGIRILRTRVEQARPYYLYKECLERHGGTHLGSDTTLGDSLTFHIDLLLTRMDIEEAWSRNLQNVETTLLYIQSIDATGRPEAFVIGGKAIHMLLRGVLFLRITVSKHSDA